MMDAELDKIKYGVEEPVIFDDGLVETTMTKDLQFHTKAIYKDRPVTVTICALDSAVRFRQARMKRDFLLCVKTRMELIHANFARFIGIQRSATTVMFLHEYCQRGTLQQFLLLPGITLDWNLKISLAVDLLQAVKIVNTCIPFRQHGLISCSTCMVDNHFNLKLVDFSVYSMLKFGFGVQGFGRCTAFDMYHIAPEIIAVDDCGKASSRSNMYAAGTLLWEIFAEKCYEDNTISVKDGATQEHNTFKSTSLAQALLKCMDNNPSERTTMETLCGLLREANGKRTVVERVMQTLAKYASELEHAVALRTQDLLVERAKCDALLQHMLPASVVEKLRRRETVLPESYSCVTLQFSDIVGFLEFVREMQPFSVVEFLNKSHGLFDEVIGGFDVYKVETISDSYFVSVINT
ncbi:atrial natriuretic peptide receptor 1-like [Paramacrobiotus metropolitanus]|uniref:atrial natriuretic peptide receptor 1-like n=1 Tax=Paramacrobiotus metropolitanus TaxID=2943436 RepID=UPI002445EB86|nr:atrial natriuretic peptide receptor 1-like [Paramacrobiotus metropolitanus]